MNDLSLIQRLERLGSDDPVKRAEAYEAMTRRQCVALERILARYAAQILGRVVDAYDLDPEGIVDKVLG